MVIYLCCLSTFLLSAQKINHLASFRNIEGERYFRFNYDNDFFTATDENYTQGYNFELVAPALRKNPLNFILIKANQQNTRYGVALEHIGFTPNEYDLPEIQFGDRPFAAAIMLRSFAISKNTVKQIRFHSALSLGLIGPGAFGKEMQTEIHEITGNKTPLGWRNQIQNDVVLNYNFGIEKQLLNLNDIIGFQIQSNLEIGTLFTNISVGSNIIIGKFQNLFTSKAQHSTFQIYVYAKPSVSLIGYDATLQGGLINRDNAYTISAGDVERLTFQYDFGLVLQTKTLYFEYTRSRISPEFQSGPSAKWGGFRVGFTF